MFLILLGFGTLALWLAYWARAAVLPVSFPDDETEIAEKQEERCHGEHQSHPKDDSGRHCKLPFR